MKTLERLNKRYAGMGAKKATSEKAESIGGLHLYQGLLEQEGTVECSFDLADSNGNLSTMDEQGVVIKIEKEDLQLNKYQTRLGSLVGVALQVSVKRVDEKTNTVYMKMNRKKSTLSTTISNEIEDDLRKNNKIVIFGRVADVRATNAWVRILDQDVIGNVKADDWAPTYTRNLAQACNKGEVYEFVITGKSGKTKDGKTIYALSHKDFIDDPWKHIPDIFQEDGVCIVQCVDKPEGKTYFWGANPLAPGIEIMCNYSGGKRITVGAVYKCRIRKFAPEEHFFKVSPYEVVNVDTSKTPIDLKKIAAQVAKEKLPEEEVQKIQEAAPMKKKRSVTKKTEDIEATVAG